MEQGPGVNKSLRVSFATIENCYRNAEDSGHRNKIIQSSCAARVIIINLDIGLAQLH